MKTWKSSILVCLIVCPLACHKHQAVEGNIDKRPTDTPSLDLAEEGSLRIFVQLQNGQQEVVKISNAEDFQNWKKLYEHYFPGLTFAVDSEGVVVLTKKVSEKQELRITAPEILISKGKFYHPFYELNVILNNPKLTNYFVDPVSKCVFLKNDKKYYIVQIEHSGTIYPVTLKNGRSFFAGTDSLPLDMNIVDGTPTFKLKPGLEVIVQPDFVPSRLAFTYQEALRMAPQRDRAKLLKSYTPPQGKQDPSQKGGDPVDKRVLQLRGG